MLILKPLENLHSYLQIKRSLDLLTQNNLDCLLNLMEEENFKIQQLNFINLSRPPSLYLNKKRYFNQNFELTPSFLEMYEMKYGLLISQELSYFLQHKMPEKSNFNFKFSNFIFHFLEFFNNLTNYKQKQYKYNKNEIAISAEVLIDMPDLIKGDCERLEEILGFLLLPIIRKFNDLVRITITCEMPQNVENSKHECKFLFNLEIIRKNDDDELEKFLRNQIFAYKNQNQQEIYEFILKNLQNEDLFLTGLNLLPFLLKILDIEYFDISSSEFMTTIKFFIPFFVEPTSNAKSLKGNFLKYNEINLDCFYQIVSSKRKKANEKEYLSYRAEKITQRSFEELTMEKKLMMEPNSSDSLKESCKSSPLKKNKNHHKVLREDLLKMVSPESSYLSSNLESAKEMHQRKSNVLLVKKELKICTKIMEIQRISEKKVEIKEEDLKIIKNFSQEDKNPANLLEIISSHIDNSMEILQEKYKETLEKTIVECLKLKENISLHEIHEELFNLIVEDNKFTFMNQRKEIPKKTNFQRLKNKNFSHSFFAKEGFF